MKHERQVVQIIATSEDGAGSDLLYALADDGSMWWIPVQASEPGAYWRRIKNIPQPQDITLPAPGDAHG